MTIPLPVADSCDTLASAERREWAELDSTGKRERVLAVASAVFTRAGIEAPMSEVADAAGAGVASVYRLFPSKHELLAALVVRRNDDIASAARRACEQPGDRWTALTEMLAAIVENQSPDEFLGQAKRSVAEHPDVVAAAARSDAALNRLLDAARREGRLRADAGTDDLRLVLCATRAARRLGPDAWQRALTLMIAGLDAQRTDCDRR